MSKCHVHKNLRFQSFPTVLSLETNTYEYIQLKTNYSIFSSYFLFCLSCCRFGFFFLFFCFSTLNFQKVFLVFNPQEGDFIFGRDTKRHQRWELLLINKYSVFSPQAGDSKSEILKIKFCGLELLQVNNGISYIFFVILLKLLHMLASLNLDLRYARMVSGEVSFSVWNLKILKMKIVAVHIFFLKFFFPFLNKSFIFLINFYGTLFSCLYEQLFSWQK